MDTITAEKKQTSFRLSTDLLNRLKKTSKERTPKPEQLCRRSKSRKSNVKPHGTKTFFR